VTRGETTVFAHLPQASGEGHRDVTVIEFMKELAERVLRDHGESLSAEQFLERFLFPRSMHGISLDRLSGGELRRLTLVRLLATAPNFLLLDEPTNDLDLDTIRQLEDYLSDFEGCILLVSHDRAMLDRLTDSLLVFDGAGGARSFTGNYEDYRAIAAAAAGAPDASPREAYRPAHEDKAGLSFKERREYAELLAEIERLESEQKELEQAFQQKAGNPVARGQSLRRYQELLGTLEKRMARWEQLAVRAGD